MFLNHIVARETPSGIRYLPLRRQFKDENQLFLCVFNIDFIFLKYLHFLIVSKCGCSGALGTKAKRSLIDGSIPGTAACPSVLEQITLPQISSDSSSV